MQFRLFAISHKDSYTNLSKILRLEVCTRYILLQRRLDRFNIFAILNCLFYVTQYRIFVENVIIFV